MLSLIGAWGMPAAWLCVIVLMLIIEAAAPGLVSIWFALGGVVALISSILKAPLWLQVFWFVAVSVASLIFTRPLAKKYVNSRVVATNADRVLGCDVVVTEDINNVRGTGAVSHEGKIWTARSVDDGILIPAGEIVEAVRIEGVKLFVRKK